MTAPPVVLEEQTAHPVLLIDKEHLLGSLLAETLLESLRVVYLSQERIIHPRCLYIPYKKSLPKIPDSLFSAIIVVYHGEKDVEQFLPELSEKARECKVPLLLVTDIYSITPSLYHHFTQIPSLQVVLLGDLLVTESSSRAEELVRQAIQNSRLHLLDMGLSPLYLTPKESFVTHVLTQAFSQQTTETICLFAKTPTTELSFARQIVKINPEVKLDFSAKKHHLPSSFVPSSALFLQYDQSLVSSWIRSYEVPPPTAKKHTSPSRKRKLRFLPVSIGLLLLLSPLFVLGGSILGGKLLLEQSVGSLKQGELVLSHQKAKTSYSFFVFADGTLKLFSPVERIGGERGIRFVREKIGMGKQLSQAVESIAHAGSLISRGVQQGEKAAFVDGVNEAGEALISVQRLYVSESAPSEIKKALQPFEESIQYFSILKETLPTLFGFEGERKYLVLFQNNNELRPGGGFIGSFVLLTVANGQLKDIKTYDVYDADGQLKGHIDPPFFLRRYLGASHWYLRDSNVSVDFSTNAKQALFFLKEELGVTADSVIGVNAEVLKLLLEKTGPLTVDTYKEQLTADNVIEITQDKAEKDFFPGSTQKKDFLSAFQKTLLAKASENPKILAAFLQTVSESTKQKHMQYFTTDSNIQDLFTTAQIAGNIPAVSQTEITDAFGVNEANVGQNKVNKYIERRFDHQVKLSEDGEMAESVTITYVNTSTKDTPYAGDYTSYLRFLLPKDSLFEAIHIDGVEQAITPAVTDERVYTRTNFVPPKELELEKEEEGEMQLLGIPFVIPQGVTKKLTISYTRKLPVWGEEVIYTRSLVKQSGTRSDPYTLNITIPDTYLIKHTILDKGQQIGQQVVTRGYLKQDTGVTLQLVKKGE